MKKRYRSLRSAFLSSILFLFIPFQVVVSIVDISISGYDLLKANKDLETLTERAIVKALKFTHASFRMLELSVADELIEVHRHFRAVYERSSGNPFRISLAALSAENSGRYKFCLLDASGNIVGTTFNPSMLFKLRGLPDFQARLAKALESGLFLSDGLDPDPGKGTVSMSSWMATADARFVLIVSKTTDEFAAQLSEFDFRSTMGEFISINPSIVSIRLFDKFGREEDRMGDFSHMDSHAKAIVTKFWTSSPSYEVSNRPSRMLTRYLYVDERFPGSFDRSRILEITWSTIKVDIKLAAKAWLQAGLIVLFTAIGIILMTIVSTRISRPIHALVEAVRAISRGDLDRTVEAKSPNELRLLERGINHMVVSLRKMIASLEESKRTIQAHSENLEITVHERTEELEQANKSIAYAFDRTRKELRTARAVQNSILPLREQDLGRVEFSAAFIPMEELGGDYFDVFRLESGVVAIVIADVVGHGISAALVTMMAKIAFVNNVLPGRKAADILTSVNAQICRSIGDVEKYLTVFFGLIDPEAGTFEYVNAGHPSAYLLRKDGTADELPPHAPLVGAFEDEQYDSCMGRFQPGDHVLLYTDGVSEARDETGEFFGIDRILGAARENMEKSCEDICRTIVIDVMMFRGAAPAEDDMTVIVTGIKGDKP